MFDKEINYEDDIQTVKLVGDLDVYSEEDFKSFIDEKIKVDKDVIFDLKDLDYLDSTGLGMFMIVYNMLKENGKSVKIVNVKENIKKLFEITDLSALFDME